jgi:hypothetical protein
MDTLRVLDTDVFIDHFRGMAAATAYILALPGAERATTGDLPDDPLIGFLPPNNNPPEGDGSVLFTIRPKEGFPTGTQTSNQATIVFDTNPPITTPVWVNTLDNTKPTSHALALAATQTIPNFQVQWSGTDVGAGISDFTIFVSDNNGPFTPFVTNTVATSATYPGVAGHTYRFFSQARDLTGNVETRKTQAEATTQGSLGGRLWRLSAQPRSGSGSRIATIKAPSSTSGVKCTSMGGWWQEARHAASRA